MTSSQVRRLPTRTGPNNNGDDSSACAGAFRKASKSIFYQRAITVLNVSRPRLNMLSEKSVLSLQRRFGCTCRTDVQHVVGHCFFNLPTMRGCIVLHSGASFPWKLTCCWITEHSSSTVYMYGSCPWCCFATDPHNQVHSAI